MKSEIKINQTLTLTEFQNNVGKYLKYVQGGNDVIIMKNGKEIARLISNDKGVSFLSDALVGVLKNDYDDEKIKEDKIKKYESIN